MNETEESGASPKEADQLLAVWQAVSQRRIAYETMMWQTPALGMTAQAFLLTLALATDTSDVARIASAALSVLISIMVIQLLGKHRKFEMLDTLTLEEIEIRLNLVTVAGHFPHSRNRNPSRQVFLARESGRSALWGPMRFWEMSSFALWCYGQYLFIVAAAAIIVTVVVGGGGILSS
ncbi:hypothetical protein [Cryobacterium sp. Y82]|uniref:hypothetical protein n=1 Tax=Cryobacterium sp. Y82 TaxID=2045017 RepID=UPI000CE4E6E7|nr:hypothetical protein [Cryobacterium sp. Y82]